MFGILLAMQRPSELPIMRTLTPISAWSCQICNQHCALYPPQNWFQTRQHQVDVARYSTLLRPQFSPRTIHLALRPLAPKAPFRANQRVSFVSDPLRTRRSFNSRRRVRHYNSNVISNPALRVRLCGFLAHLFNPYRKKLPQVSLS
jgi:hypothetical protein